MKKLLEIALSEVTNLKETRERVVDLFASIKNQRIGYVVGIINSDGPKFVQRNRKLLIKYTQILQGAHKIPLFCAVDIFSDSVCKRLQEYKLSIDKREEQFYKFWRNILSSGHITDIFMTPRWNLSTGARDEHNVAIKHGLKVHYVEDQLNGFILL